MFSVLESCEVKFPALEGFVLPTYFPSRLGNLTNVFLIPKSYTAIDSILFEMLDALRGFTDCVT